jgi:ribosome maturation factor RimP
MRKKADKQTAPAKEMFVYLFIEKEEKFFYIMEGIEGKIKEKINTVLKSMKDKYSLEGLDIQTNDGIKLITVYVQKPGGITIDDCAHISEKVSVHLDVCDFIPGSYRLEVSSPGIEKKAAK